MNANISDVAKDKLKKRANSWKRVIQSTKEVARSDSSRRPAQDDRGDNKEISRALADAFSRSAYYQYAGGIHSVDDLEEKMCKEARNSRWLTAKNKISFVKALKEGSSGSLHSIVKAATAMASMGNDSRSVAADVDLEKG